MMIKAMKEDKKICKKTKKIVKWANQASMRMEVSGIADELSGNENYT